MTGTNGSADEHATRVLRNESIYRVVNEGIEYLDQTFANSDEKFAIICECGEMECVDRIPIATAAYAQVRTDPALFIVIPGHEDPNVEAVVESRHAGYVVVRKTAAPQPS